MKICIPTMGERGLDEMVGEHFGRVPTYTIYDTDTQEVKVIQNISTHTGGTLYAPELIKNAGANIMLCGGLGRRAIMMFEEFGIEVYAGARGTVREVIDRFNDGQYARATQDTACAQHAFRGEGHGESCGSGLKSSKCVP